MHRKQEPRHHGTTATRHPGTLGTLLGTLLLTLQVKEVRTVTGVLPSYTGIPCPSTGAQILPPFLTAADYLRQLRTWPHLRSGRTSPTDGPLTAGPSTSTRRLPVLRLALIAQFGHPIIHFTLAYLLGSNVVGFEKVQYSVGTVWNQTRSKNILWGVPHLNLFLNSGSSYMLTEAVIGVAICFPGGAGETIYPSALVRCSQTSESNRFRANCLVLYQKNQQSPLGHYLLQWSTL